ncbi:phytanoyl-CoA dioxygenase family protein [Marinomonas rhizomae]|uniref:phytanoyl-CoA dioxygenase family protein n=1 Tax=Marinomonas rhizomae TaxID=491948 RepID=UPI002101DB41|nr:phytanoyl-CoA dioxygenase family protein [Marinomonas rhizomae]UTV99903.1 phytanoyl-CoA dioxygenase family protein [Marinomonas rhizomae]
MTVSKQEDFQNKGVLKLSNVIDVEKVADVQTHLWQEVDRKFGIHIDEPNTWFSNANNPVGDARAKRLNGVGSIMRDLKASGKLDDIERAIQLVIDQVFGADTWRPLDLWYSLLSFPGSESVWNVPHKSWHCDEPCVVGDAEPWSLFVFVLLDNVTTDMGATTVISGSHRRAERLAKTLGTSNNEALINAFESVNSGLFDNPNDVTLLPMDQVLDPLIQEDPWFQELVQEGSPDQRIQRFIKEGSSLHNIEQKVVTLTGIAGDIIVFDPRCLHTFSANVSNLPRQVLRLDFRRQL